MILTVCEFDNDAKFEKKYLRKLERNWAKWKGKDKTARETNSSSRSRNLEEGIILKLQSLDLSFF